MHFCIQRLHTLYVPFPRSIFIRCKLILVCSVSSCRHPPCALSSVERPRWLLLYASLAVLRVLLSVLQGGYVHADEFFQSPEPISGALFGYRVHYAWEWRDGPHGISRSAVIPLLNSGLPLWLLQQTRLADNAWALLIIPRLFSVLWSFAIDVCVVLLCRRAGMPTRTPLLLLASSYVMCVFCGRPFSNGAEAVVLMLSLVAAAHRHSFLFGILCAIGVFTRVTFPAFALPIGVALLYDALSRRRIFLCAFSIASGALFATALCVAADSAFFGRPFLAAPLNNALYNAQSAHLADHVLHPRYVHVLLNLPMLFSPAAPLWLAWRALSGVRRWLAALNDLQRVCLAVITSSLLILSAIPHQEPRFLVPLAAPLAIVAASDSIVTRAGPAAVALWIAFNVIGGIGYGHVHQGGLVPALVYVRQSVIEGRVAATEIQVVREVMRGLPGAEEGINMLKSDWKGVKSGDLEAICGDLETICEEFASICTELTVKCDALATISGDLATVSNEVSTISGELATTSNELSTISGELSTISGDLAVQSETLPSEITYELSPLTTALELITALSLIRHAHSSASLSPILTAAVAARLPFISLFFWHTYMPPRYLLARRDDRVKITDLSGAPAQELATELATWRESAMATWNESSRDSARAFLFAPATAPMDELAAACGNSCGRLEVIERFAPHVTMEHFGRYFEMGMRPGLFQLIVYRVVE